MTVNDQFVRIREKIGKVRRKIEMYANISGRLLNTIYDTLIIDLNNQKVCIQFLLYALTGIKQI